MVEKGLGFSTKKHVTRILQDVSGGKGLIIISGRYSKRSPAAAGSDRGPRSPTPRCGSSTCAHTFPVRKKQIPSLFWGSIISVLLGLLF